MLRQHRAIFLAAALLALGGLSTLHSLGGDAKAPKVDRQGDPLPDGALARLGSTRWRHGSVVNFLAFPSDKTVLTASRDGTIRLWDRATGKEIRRFEAAPVKVPGNPQPGGVMFPQVYRGNLADRIAIAPDGKIFAAVVGSNAIQLWDVDTGKELRRLKGLPDGINDLLFSPDGKTLAVTTVTAGNRSIHVIKTENGDEICQIKTAQQKGPVRLVLGGRFAENAGLAFSHDGKTLASAEIDFGQQKTTYHLKLTDIQTGKEIRKTELPDAVSTIAYSPDGKMLAHASGAAIVLREPDTDKEIHTLKNAGGIATIAFSPDSKTLAVKSRDHVVRLWDANTGKSLHEFGEPVVLQPAGGNAFFIMGAAYGLETRDLAFSRDGKTVGVGGSQTPRFYSVTDGKEQALSGGHKSGVSTLALAPDGKTMISRGADHFIRRWNTRTGEELSQFAEPAGTLGVAISPDAKTIAFANADGSIRIHSAESGAELHKVKGHQSGVAALAFSADNKMLATRGGADNTIRLFDVAGGGEIRSIPISTDEQPGRGNVFILGGGGGTVPHGLAFAPDGASISTSTISGNPGGPSMIRTWDIATGKETRQVRFSQQRSVNCLAYSPDGRLLAAENSNRTVSLWEVASGKERAILGEPVPVTPRGTGNMMVIAGAGFGPGRATAPPTPTIAFSPAGNLLAARAPGNAVRVWEVAFAKEAGQFKGHSGEVATLAFAPDGKSIASGSADTTILVWDAARLKLEPAEAIALSGDQMQAHWADLLGADAVKAGQSIRALAAAREAAAFLAGRLKPAAAIDPKKIEQWITDLDSGNFQKRNKAAEELERIGELARPALKKILDSEPSPETRRRVEPLLEKLITGTLSAEQLRMVRGIEILERSGSTEARQLLATLAKGAAGALPTRESQDALARLSKKAAAQQP